MLKRPRHGLAMLAGPAPARQQVGARDRAGAVRTMLRRSQSSETARRLAEIGAWGRATGRKKSPVLERRRVNVVSEPLCEDIIKYLGPSLERHRGCDLVDLNPGAGLWSRKLHQFLQPRKHIMMEPDAEIYRPFLEDLVSLDKVHLIAESGLVWRHLLEMIRLHLSHQRPAPHEATPSRNDTLLVTANLSMSPKKAYLGFESVSVMVLYQFLSSIRTASLFQRYGLVRMLVWVNDEDTRRLVPRSINRRRRSAFEAELSCEWIHQVVGEDSDAADRYSLRDDWLNLESGHRTWARMQAHGIVMPPGRETRAHAAVKASPELAGVQLAGLRPPTMARPFKQELEQLEAGQSSDEASKRLKALRHRERYDQADSRTYLKLLQQLESIAHMADSSSFAAANAAWNREIESLKKNARNEFLALRDNYHLFRQTPPAMFWDRRLYEPLAAAADEFYPATATALLDMQPKPMRPIFRHLGPGSSRSGDMSDLMLRFLFRNMLMPMPRAMDSLWSGFGDALAHCPALRDGRLGGSPLTHNGALTVRAMNELQWAEMVQAWMAWPFRPSFFQMLGRLEDDGLGLADAAAADDDTKSNAGHLSL